MIDQRSSSLWIIWPLWVLLSAIGGGVGFLMGLDSADLISRIIDQSILDEPIIYGILGTSTAFLQWIIIRAYLPKASRWVLASAASWILIGALADRVEIKGNLVFLLPAVLGATVGTCQWLVLYNHIPKAGFWIVANVVGRVFGWHIGSAMDELVSMFVSSERFGLAVLFSIYEGIVAIFTGFTLIWMLRQTSLESKLRENTKTT